MKSPIISRCIQFNARSSFFQQKTIPRIRHATLPRRSRAAVTQSGLNSWLIFIVSTGVVLSGSLYSQQVSDVSDIFNSKVQPPGSEGSPPTKEYHGMVATKLPGRPGNLTKEQETKLQELWTETFRVFGVELLVEHGEVDEKNAVHPLDVAESDKKKKKRTGMFSRRRHGESLDEAQTGGSRGSVGAGDLDDKYGQNKEFQHTLATMTPEEIRDAFWGMVKHDNPDALLLRFLRARKWDVHKALVMLIATLRWRVKDMRVDDDIMKNGESAAVADSESSDKAVKKEGTDFMTALRLGKAFFRGNDKDGRPICNARVRLHRQGEQTEASIERYTVYIIETARLLLAPGVDTAAIIFDMTDFSMANMEYAPVKFMIKCFEANYPESLGIVLVHKAPWIFQGIWSIIKGWLDPVVASKIHFTKTIHELEHYIDRKHIIKDLGGDDAYTYRYIEPSSSENDRLADTDTRTRLQDERAALVRDFEKTTQEWIKETWSSSTSSTPEELGPLLRLQEKRLELTRSLRSGYWQLDPYLRAKTIYDRVGMIGEGGIIDLSSTSASESPNDDNNGNKATNNKVNSHPSSSTTPTTTTRNAAPDTVAGHRDHDLD